MKSLKSYLTEETHNNFLVNKKIKNKIQKSWVSTTKAKRDIDFPILKQSSDPSYDFEYKGSRKVTIPDTKFYVFKDNYHHQLHICNFEDIIQGIGSWYEDYEDFNPKYIVGAFDTLEDAVKFAIEDMGYVGDFNDIENLKDWIDENHTGKYYDSEKFMKNVLDGNITDDNYEGGANDTIEDVIELGQSIKK